MSTIKCPQCSLVNWAKDILCKRCGFAFQAGETATEPFADPVAVFHPEPTQILPTEYFQTPQNGDALTSTAYEPARRGYQPENGKKKVGLAVMSMIAGIIGMPPISTFGAAFLGVILATGFGTAGFVIGMSIVLAFIPFGLIGGIVAFRRSKYRSNEYGGRGYAIGGIVCSSIAAVTLPIIAAIAIPNLLAARRAANEGLAVSTMRKLASAEEILGQQSKGACGDIKTLAGTSLIDKSLETGEKSGYRYTVVNYPAGGCEIHGTPLTSNTGSRSFYYSTNDRTLRAGLKKGLQASNADPVVQDPSSKNDELPAKIALQKSR